MKFTKEQTDKWKSIPLTYVTDAANLTCKGVNWKGCSKEEVYDTIDKEHYKCNIQQFADIMDLFAFSVKDSKEKLEREVDEILVSYGEFNKKNKL